MERFNAMPLDTRLTQPECNRSFCRARTRGSPGRRGRAGVLALLLAIPWALIDAADVPRPVILILGDSLSANFGIDVKDGWATLLQQRLDGIQPGYRVVNASISGDTTRGGLGRLPAALAAHRPAIVVIELGANDGLRGFPLAQPRRNLGRMIQLVQAQGARPLLVGMRLPPNYGPRYTADFHAMFGSLSEEFGVPLVPFLLDGIATDYRLMQADGIHPTAEAQRLILDNVWTHLEPMLKPSEALGHSGEFSPGNFVRGHGLLLALP